MEILQFDLTDRTRVRQFLELPVKIYRTFPCWVPPLEPDMKKALDPRRHPFYRRSQAAFFLALNDQGEPVGRIAALDDRTYNEYFEASTANFYFFECFQDGQAAAGLFEAAMGWARQRGLKRMIGPKGLTALDGRGILVAGYEHPPAFGMNYNPPYYVDFVEAAGFTRHRETVSGYLTRDTARFPGRIHELADRVAERRGLKVVNYRTRAQLRRMTRLLKDLYNGSLSGARDNVPITDEDVRSMVASLLLIADPHLVKLVMKEEVVVGYILAYPDISRALQRTGGRLLPFGWLDMLIESRRTRTINLNGVGLMEEYRGLGGSAILASGIAKSIISRRHYLIADFVQLDVENDLVQREIANFGVNFCKRHRIYTREL